MQMPTDPVKSFHTCLYYIVDGMTGQGRQIDTKIYYFKSFGHLNGVSNKIAQTK